MRQGKSSSARFFLSPSVAILLEFYLEFNYLSNATIFRPLASILSELSPFSYINFWNYDFWGSIFFLSDPLGLSQCKCMLISLHILSHRLVYFEKKVRYWMGGFALLVKMIDLWHRVLRTSIDVPRPQWVNQRVGLFSKDHQKGH